jgi:murein tripeptide amidase MpaA
MSFPFDRYINYAELTEGLERLAAAHPNLVSVQSLGKSYEGREIWCATLTNSSTGPAEEKPALWADGNIHASEVSATTACTKLLMKLVEGYGKDADVTRALDTRAFYIVPRLNPDGAEHYLTTGLYVRSSMRPYPFDEEPIEGLERGDIDGDGRQLQMRIPDPDGPWKAHPEDPRLMVRREPTETGGMYYRILPEGRIKNFDGQNISIFYGKQGLDLNRNFPASWRPEHQQHGAGPFPTSEPEIRAAALFLSKHKNVCHAITFHTYSGVLLRPYGTQSDENFPAEDLWLYETIGKKGEELTGYPAISVFHDFKYHPKEVITGVFDDWAYEHLGALAWTVEIWSPQRQAGIVEGMSVGTKKGAGRYIEWWRTHPIEEALQLLKWSDEKLGGKGYVDWRPFEHPELGPVELGGWDALYAFRNPPGEFLEAEVAPLADWLLWQALTTPKLEKRALDVTSLGDNCHHIRLTVKNTGYLPSYGTKKALERQRVRGVIAEISLPDSAELVQGKERVQLGQLEGYSAKAPTNAGYPTDITADRATVEWVVRAPKGTEITVCARHERAGVVRETVTL